MEFKPEKKDEIIAKRLIREEAKRKARSINMPVEHQRVIDVNSPLALRLRKLWEQKDKGYGGVTDC